VRHTVTLHYDDPVREEERNEGALWYAIAAGLIVTVAAAIRIRGLGTTLFEDEVWVARLFRDGGLAPHTYNIPLLYYAIGRTWVRLRGVSDIVLREPAAFFGVALCALPLVAPRSLRTRLLWSILLAFSSPLIFYSTRAKQYTLEAFVVTALIVVFLCAYEGDGRWAWIAFFVTAAAGVTTLHSPVFVVFAAAIVVVFTRRVRRAPLMIGFILVGALFLAAWFLYVAPGPATPQLHGDMEQWFTQTGRWVGSMGSFIANSRHWLGQAMNLVPLWWAVLTPLVLLWLFGKKEFALFALAAIPPLITVVTSALHLYPYGEVRLMIFSFPALFLVIAESLASASRRIPILLIAVVPFIISGVARDPYNATYMHTDDLRRVYTTVMRDHRRGDAIYANPTFAAPLSYYFPTLGTDLHAVVIPAPQGRGWYLQRASQFDPRGSTVVIREGDMMAAFVP
jgi:hypothetical protein